MYFLSKKSQITLTHSLSQTLVFLLLSRSKKRFKTTDSKLETRRGTCCCSINQEVVGIILDFYRERILERQREIEFWKMGSKKSGGGDFNVPLDPSHPMYRSSDIDLKDVERVRSSTSRSDCRFWNDDTIHTYIHRRHERSIRESSGIHINSNCDDGRCHSTW